VVHELGPGQLAEPAERADQPDLALHVVLEHGEAGEVRQV
jgi:hypothetical protein